MVFISIDYDEGSQDTYRAVVLKNRNSIIRFETGDPVSDFLSASLHAINLTQGTVSEIMLKSSCDHFVQDGNDYKWIEDDFGSRIIKNGA